jgi:carboxyl-terminal processing protease
VLKTALKDYRTSLGAALVVVMLALAVAATPPEKTGSGRTDAENSQTQVEDTGREHLLPGPAESVEDLILLERSARSLPPVEASPDEGLIAGLTAENLELRHYRRQRFDDEVSSRFLERYIESLDNLRLHFLQTDLEEFEKYRNKLDDLTLSGNTEPSREIFARFLQRVEQRVAYVAELLDSETFDFTGDDRYLLDRRKAAFAKDMTEARMLWRQHLRYEVLQELLNQKEPAPSDSNTTDQAESTNAAPETARTDNALPDEVLKTMTRRYSRLLRTLSGFDGDDVFEIYLGALAHVYDPHSDYLGRASLENFAINMNLSLFGIGAVLQSEDGYCKVRELRPGPAMRSQRIKPGDRIVAVAQDDEKAVDVVDWKLSKVVDLIRGPKGTRVRLTIIPVDATDPSERVEVALVRDEIRLEDAEAKAQLIELPAGEVGSVRVGVIDLPSFYAPFDMSGGVTRTGRSRSTTIDVANLIEKLKEQGAKGLILDLRQNGGGSLEEAIELTGLFIDEGPVVQVRDPRGGVIQEKDEQEGVLYDGPLVVLTSRHSASASEILAGALQDYGRALIVGDSSTHGKGTVQSMIQLKSMLAPGFRRDPGAIKVTVRKFYRASGESTQQRGVVPDIVLPSVNNHAELGEASLEDALPWDTISSARFVRENRVAPLLDQLRERSDQRISADPDFQYIQEDIELYRQFLADKSVSLNLEERRREKAENEARLEARKKERAARPETDEAVYEFTLSQLRDPGLPNPKSEAPAEPHSGTTGEEEAEELDRLDDTPDVALREAKRILLDFIQLSETAPALADQRKGVPTNVE